ncbi:MAG: hypothetical protein ABI843_10450 [Dokdonella sp.]
MEKTRDDAADIEALRLRFPKPTPLAAAYQCATILGTNAFLFYLVVTGQSSPVAIALYGILEVLMLSAISHVALLPVPRDSRVGDPAMPMLQRMGVLSLALIWLAGVYWISLSGDKAHLDPLLYSGDPLKALAALTIWRPLLISAVLVAVAAIGDWLDWRRRGGVFVSNMALSGAPKIVTLIVAPIPAVLISGAWVRDNPARAAIVWSLVYIAIKCAAEVLVLYWQYLGMPQRQANAVMIGTRSGLAKRR